MRFRLERIYERPNQPQLSDRSQHVDQAFSCWYLHEGLAEVRQAGQAWRLEPGSWQLNPSGIRRDQRISPGVTIFSVRFQARGPLLSEGLPLIVPGDALMPQARALLECQDQQSAGADVRREGCFLQFIATWLDLLEQHGARLHRLGAKDQRVATAVRLLEAQPGLGPLPYEQLCQAADCSRSQLDRLFRKDLGMSPRAWQEQRTLAEAQSLLNRGEWDVGSIARHLRFSDSSHFAKWFRRLSGCAPRAWQEPA